jgi:hypothetical protein
MSAAMSLAFAHAADRILAKADAPGRIASVLEAPYGTTARWCR